MLKDLCYNIGAEGNTNGAPGLTTKPRSNILLDTPAWVSCCISLSKKYIGRRRAFIVPANGGHTMTVETNIQRYLRGGHGPDDLEVEYAISHRRAVKYPNLVSFKYSQIDSDLSLPIVREARGIVLDEADNWRVVARGFDKFFNYGEPYSAEIDWATARVQEKLDGSLCMLYRYQQDAIVATTGTPDASGACESSPHGATFAHLFWATWKQYGFTDADLPPAGHTYLFELCTPWNRVVIPHATPRLVLLAIRGTWTGQYIRPGNKLPFERIREFPLDSFQAIADSLASINPLEQEGYVVMDGAGNRVKVKHPQYVALHHLKEHASTKGFVEVIRRGEVNELLAAFPELESEFTNLQAQYQALVDEIDGRYQELRDIELQKDFALQAVQYHYAPVLFALRAGHSNTPAEFLSKCTIEAAMKLLRLSNTVEAKAA